MVKFPLPHFPFYESEALLETEFSRADSLAPDDGFWLYGVTSRWEAPAIECRASLRLRYWPGAGTLSRSPVDPDDRRGIGKRNI